MSASGSSRTALLRLHCEAQRQQLASQFAEVERKLQNADAMIGSARRLLAKPVTIIGGVALLFAVRRLGFSKVLSRGLMLFATARRFYGLFKGR